MLWSALAVAAPRYQDAPALPPEGLWTPLPVGHVDVGGIDVAVQDSGGDGPVVLLVHGLSSYGSYWARVIEALPARGTRVIAVDLPGYGASGRDASWPYTPPWYATVLVGLLDTLDVERAAVIGHSMGGQIALTLALDAPDRVSALVLSAPAGFERFRPGERALLTGWWTPSRAMDTPEVEVRAAFTTAAFATQDDLVERWIEERVRLGRHPAFAGTSLAVSRSIAGMLDHPVWDRLPEIGVPTRVVFGTRDAMIPNPVLHGGTTRSVAEAGTARIPGATLVMIPGAGHTVHHDAPAAFLDAAWTLLDSVLR
jgi:pimeloyl-ACP methyl ester carboxylesterase